MMKHLFLIIAFVCCEGALLSQTFTDSNLPIVIITTDGGTSIPDEPGVMGNMKIIYRGPGERNYITDQTNSLYLNYNGRIDIERRGSSSQSFEKKNYGFTTMMDDDATNNNVSLLGMPEENDWILGGMVFDTAMMRDYLCDNLARQLGNYASRTSYCEVVINGNYRGLYMLQEKIKADKERVDVTKITDSDNTLPDITGGYITKADKTTGDDEIAWTMDSWWGAEVNYIHHLPKPENATAEQTEYIKGVFYDLEKYASDNNTSVTKGYPSVIDIPSFLDYIILNELASNPDAYQYSTYFHKDRNGKLRAGPIWDMDLTFGNDLKMWGYDRSQIDLWYSYDYWWNNGSTFWWNLFNDASFRCYLSRRWHELQEPDQPLNKTVIEAFIDNIADSISEAVTREYTRWNKTGTLEERVVELKSFIEERKQWINENIGGYAACEYIEVPELVITKIMYHPLGTTLYPDPEDLEFIELSNNSDATASLSGLYFGGTGFVYQFPAGSSLAPYQSIILAGNSSAFQSKYGFAPFGEFTRSLSNDNENIILLDAFGNVVDVVHYYDTMPWPDADGNGYYLKLFSINLDNSLATSWIASGDIITSSDNGYEYMELKLYPNPVHDILNIQLSSGIEQLFLYDMRGVLLYSGYAGCETYPLEVSQYAPGTYIIKVTSGTHVYTRRIVKR